MKLVNYFILFLIFNLPFIHLSGQNASSPIKAFKFRHFNGYLNFYSYYNYKTWEKVGTKDNYNISYLSPSASIDAKTYILHPNFLCVDIKADYTPELKKNLADINPDVIERISRKSIDLSAVMLQNKDIKLYSYFKINDGYYNNEEISFTKTFGKYWEVKLVNINKKLPFLVTYSKRNSESENTTNFRKYNFEADKLIAKVSKTFFKKDLHYFQYKYLDDERNYNNLIAINNRYNEFNLNNKFFFDKKYNYLFHSIIRENIISGFQNSKEFTIHENLLFKLPYQLEFKFDYQHNNYSNESINQIQNKIHTNIAHQLFRSLKSSVFYDFDKAKQTQFDYTLNQAGVKLNYQKKIPTGILAINYYRSFELMNRNNEQGIIQVVNELHTISDGSILLLRYPFIDKASIIVRSMNQTLIYQENLDYYLVDQGDFIEIQRIPGGLIENNSVIYIDYTAQQAGTSSYTLSRQGFNTKVSIFKQLLSVYYNFQQDKLTNSEFYNQHNKEQFKQNIFGVESRSKYHIAGIEYKNRESTLISIQMLKYYAKLNFNFKKFKFWGMASHNYYFKYGFYSNQNYFYSSLNLSYRIQSNTQIQYKFHYRKQKGDNIFIDVTKSQLEYSSKIRSFSYSFGLEYFHRYVLLDRTNLGGVFIKATRKF